MWRSGITSVRELWAMQTRPCTSFSSSSCTCFFSFYKCWKRARSEHQQSNGLHLSCCPVFAAPCCWFFSSSRTHGADQVAIKGSKSEMKTCKQQAGFTSRMSWCRSFKLSVVMVSDSHNGKGFIERLYSYTVIQFIYLPSVLPAEEERTHTQT